MNLPLVNEVYNNNMIHWWVDANVLVHTEAKIRIKIFITMGKVSIIDMTKKHKDQLQEHN